MCINLTDYIAKGPIKESIIQLLLAMQSMRSDRRVWIGGD